MIRRNSPVVRASHHQNGRIFRSVDNVMVWRIRIKRLELLRVFYSAEFGHVERAIWCELHAQHIVNSYLGTTALIKAGCWVIIAPIRRPPLLPPWIANFSGRVYPSLIRYSATAGKSSNTLCFFVRLPALRQSSPNSPPPRIFATTYTPPRSNQSRRVNSKVGDRLSP